MDDNKIVITDNNGEENVFEILFTYEDEENGNKYVMYYSEDDDEQMKKLMNDRFQGSMNDAISFM